MIDVLGHLVHAEETDWITRARNILEHGEARAFEPFDRFAQIARVMGKQYGDATGPWKAYLPILSR